MRPMPALAAVVLAACGSFVGSVAAEPISYQGRVSDAGAEPVGDYDIGFQIFDSAFGGSPVGTSVVRSVTLAEGDNGVFAFDDLDFGAGVFTGADRWIEISVKRSSDGAFTTLGPRQPVRATPYAIYAENAGVSLQDAYLRGNTITEVGGNHLVIAALTQIGTPTSSGYLRLFMSGSSFPAIQSGSIFGFGGQTRWYDENGANIAYLEADQQGAGASLRLVGASSIFEWDANVSAGIPGSRFSITGPTSGMSFHTAVAGDGALVLPASSVSSEEIADEAGLASDAQSSGVTLNQNFQTIISRSITVPGPGNVVVLASGSTSVQRISNAVGIMVLGVSDAPTSLPDTQQMVLQIGPNGITSFFNYPVTAHGVFETPAAGTYTFYFNGNSQGFGTPRVFDANITLLYVPTTYGDVTPTLLAPDGGYDISGPVRGPKTEQELLKERLAEQDRALRELRAEQERMRRQLEKMHEMTGGDS